MNKRRDSQVVRVAKSLWVERKDRDKEKEKNLENLVFFCVTVVVIDVVDYMEIGEYRNPVSPSLSLFLCYVLGSWLFTMRNGE